jgi:hypothetical protein
MQNFIEELNIHGQRVTNCTFSSESTCSGIEYNRSIGILPRCLFFDNRDQTESVQIIVAVGKNPGISGLHERNALAGLEDYEQVIAYFKDNYKNHPFYSRTYELLYELELTQIPILWTEMAKCEGKGVWSETLAFCSSQYLRKEIELVRKHFDKVYFVALSRLVYDLLIHHVDKEKVIGFPHPTGSYGKKFTGLLSDKIELNQMREFLFSDHLTRYRYFSA